MRARVYREPIDVRLRLADLGLEEELLQDSVYRGHFAFVSCTANHPPFFPGMSAWAEIVRALREWLLPKGWLRSNWRNYALCVHPEGRIALAVATGSDATGQEDRIPTTNSSKGPSTSDAVVANQLEFEFMSQVAAGSRDSSRKAGHQTWILLIHRAPDEVRSELSLPIAIGEDGHISAWRERILLRPIPLDGDAFTVVPSSDRSEELDVPIRRKA